MVALLLTLAGLASLTNAFFLVPKNNLPLPVSHGPSLADLALQKVLQDASPIFGEYIKSNDKRHGDHDALDTSRWMSKYPDSTPIVSMNIPGVHDAATWNYTTETQQYLDHVTSLVNVTEVDPRDYRCQKKSMVDALNAGIRVFDLRYAYDVTKSTLVFWHGPGLQSQTATVDDVLFGFYQWLDDHPTEALFLSFQYEGTTFATSSNDAGVQALLYRTLTTPAAKNHILQTTGFLGTLGQARSKITLLKRFDLSLLPPSFSSSLPGLHFSPTNWTDNGDDIHLIYNTTTGATAYIEDYYQPLTPPGSSAEANIRYKFNATRTHLAKAAKQHLDSLFWTFASSTNIGNEPPDFPEIQALGNGTLTPKGGVNAQVRELLGGFRGKRLGIVMFDFFETPSDLIPTFLGLLDPGEKRYD